jgi:hypothetical protein
MRSVSGRILVYSAVVLLVCTTIGAATVPVKVRVGYLVAGSQLTAEDNAAVAWLKKDPRFDVRITDVTVAKWVPPVCDVLWLHSPGPEPYGQIHALPAVVRALRSFLSGKGSVLATGYAAFLAHDLGFESVRPVVRMDTLQNDWLWDKKGYHALHGHPLLQGLFGGDYIEDGIVDRILPIISYDGSIWPAKGKVVAVEKSYVFLRGERKVAIEHRPGRGRLLSLGGMIAFAPVNHLRANLEQFMQNALLYTAGVRMPGPVTYWEKMGPTPIRERIASRPLRRITMGALDPALAGDLLMTRDSGKTEMFDVAGRRALIMGKERGGIDEVWVHPLRIMRDYQAGIVSGDSVRWLHNIAPSVEVRPASFTRHYRIGNAELHETIVPSLTQAGGIARYESTVPVRLVIRFRADLRWMWPFDASALGTLHYGYDEGLKVLRVHDRTGVFVSMFGADAAPAKVLTGHFGRIEWDRGTLSGTPATDHQVAFGAEYKLGGATRRHLTFAFAGTNEGEAACEKDYRVLAGDPVGIHRTLAAHYRTLLERTVGITTPDEEFNVLYKWAIVGADRFVAYTPGVGTGLLAGFATTARGWNGAQRNSGRPGYAWYFGRDAAWSGFAFDGIGDVATVRHELELYQSFQDRTGKIFHELMTSGVVHFDASDATPMYVMLAAHYMRASGDTAFIRTSWAHLTKAMDFLYSTDTDGDGLIENTDVGHGWVEPGGVLFGTHSEYYLSVLWARALEDAGTMAALMHDTERSELYRQRAQQVRKSLNSEYWLPKSDFFSHGKIQNGSFATHRTVFPAVGLIWGMVDGDKASPLLRAYASSEFSTDWGVRGLSGLSPYFNPRGYQEGAAWPLFTGWTALGEFTYGNSVQAFTHVKELMLIKKNWSLGFVQEVMNGAVYRPTGVCFHQCWSETNILHPVMEGLIGWKPDAPHASASLTPRFPIDWDNVTVDRLRSGPTVLQMTMKRVPAYMTYVLKRSEGPACTVTLSPEIPAGMRIGRVLIDGAPYFWNAATERGLLKQPVVVRVDSTVTVSFEYTGGLAMIPLVPRPVPGDSTLAPRLLGTSVNDGLYTVEVEGRGGTTAIFPLKFYGFESLRVVGAQVRRGVTPGIWECEVRFDPSVHGYVKHLITLRPE